MKTITITAALLKGFVLATLMIAFTSTSFGQFGSFGLQSNLKTMKSLLSLNKQQEVTHTTYDVAKNNYTGYIDYNNFDFRSWIKEGAIENVSITPVVSHTSLSDVAEAIQESDFESEAWLTAEFEISELEEDLVVETWMATSFETSDFEEDLIVETWMTTSFASNDFEEGLIVESWMAKPFEFR